MKRMLLVDNDINITHDYKQVFEDDGFQVEVADDEAQAILKVAEGKPDIVLLDIALTSDDDDRGGVRILESLRERWSKEELPVIIMSGVGDNSLTIEVMNKGADDFLAKPVDDLRGLVEKVNELVNVPDYPLLPPMSYEDKIILGKSKTIKYLTKQIYKFAKAECNVLFLGECGTGKTQISKLYHRLSLRSEKPYCEIYLPMLTHELFLSELFGYVKDSHSRALENKPGLVEAASGGVLLLDEIGDVPLKDQVKLLEFIDTKKYTPVGGGTKKILDAIILMATSQPLEEMMKQGNFRAELFYRMKDQVITIPPLREHREDIPILVNHFIGKYNLAYGKNIVGANQEAMDRFMEMSWKGNVRELEKSVGQSIMRCTGQWITLRDIPASVPTLSNNPASKETGSSLNLGTDYQAFKQENDARYELMEREYFSHHLDRNHGDVSQTAKAIGMKNASQLYEILKRLGLK